MEPLPVSRLGNLTSSQQALAEFLEVDQDLLAGAGMGSPAGQDDDISQKKMDAWIDALPRDEMKAVLKQLLGSKGQQAKRTLKVRFAAWRRGLQTDKTEAPCRTVEELRKNAEAAQKIRMEKQKRDRKRREIKRRREREAALKNLSKDFPKAWKSVQQTVELGSGLAYDDACRFLIDISKAYTLHASRKRFEKIYGRPNGAQGPDSTPGESRYLEG